MSTFAFLLHVHAPRVSSSHAHGTASATGARFFLSPSVSEDGEDHLRMITPQAASAKAKDFVPGSSFDSDFVRRARLLVPVREPIRAQMQALSCLNKTLTLCHSLKLKLQKKSIYTEMLPFAPSLLFSVVRFSS